ncbi:hypothetical protein [Kitasatospora azatica]|uniref:hypothetical protein n=1 Tax=Kitasatospora azatica TaxID=58347 RepID=UPI0012F8C72C|nr:hypothetical protein [Kitasatospora azatica]
MSGVLLCTDEARIPLPNWAAWLAELGAWAVELAAEGVSGTVAVSVPAREYASVLLGCGAVYAAFQPQLDTSPEGSQFDRAVSLVPRSHVVRLIPTRNTTGFVGILNEAVIKHNRKGYNVGGSWFPADQYRIDVLRWPDSPREFMGRSRTLEPIDIPDGADGLFPGAAADFCGFSTLHCAIVGNGRAIQQESGTLVAASAATEPIPLSALLRLRSVRDKARQFRSLLLPAREDPEDYRELVAARKPRVTILDGAATVCRWLGAGMSPITVALVERTAPSGDSAADVLERYRARSLRDLPLPADLARVPAGIEVLAWQSRVGNP